MYGLFQAPRALTVQSAAIPQIAGQPSLVPLKLEGVEGINRLFEYRLTLQTPDALNFTGGQGSNFELDGFIGKEITCFIELEGHGSFVAGVMGSNLGGIPNQGAGVREISALITDARYIGQDNRHALYELTLRPWLHLATLTNSEPCMYRASGRKSYVTSVCICLWWTKILLTRHGAIGTESLNVKLFQDEPYALYQAAFLAPYVGTGLLLFTDAHHSKPCTRNIYEHY